MEVAQFWCHLCIYYQVPASRDEFCICCGGFPPRSITWRLREGEELGQVLAFEENEFKVNRIDLIPVAAPLDSHAQICGFGLDRPVDQTDLRRA